MKTEWNLDIFYKGYDDPSYEEDIKKVQAVLAKKHELAKQLSDQQPTKEMVEALLKNGEEEICLFNDLFIYSNLRTAVNTEDAEAMAQFQRVIRMYSESAADSAAISKYLGKVEDIESFVAGNDFLTQYKFLLENEKKNLSHMLSNEVEAMVAAMSMTGKSAWGNLHSFLTSTVEVDYDGKTVTLSEIRNLAYDADPAVRKAAYQAELAGYKKIEASVAFALNNIKNESILMANKRGYKSALDMALEKNHMSRETLDAMMEAVEEYLPVFRKYLRKKGQLLGHSNGLPFYDLFAPLGESDKKYTVEEAKAYLEEAFTPLSPEISGLMTEAFENEWIDFFPRNGKQGGAFCCPTFTTQSRILTNFDGTFGAVDTLAHELGHAFHNRQLEKEAYLNREYSMPVAETASTFNEVHLGAYALKSASDSEKLALLENDLREKTQCIVDIYSRFVFEKSVFENCQQKFLMADDFCKMMLEAQDKAYGDGLDPEFKHPYMWLCKGHYYGSDFYNYPYTFGNLFAQGLYAQYLKEGEAFLPKYKEMLRLTPVSTIEESGKQIGVDLTKKDFWKASLELMAEEIEEFCKL